MIPRVPLHASLSAAETGGFSLFPLEFDHTLLDSLPLPGEEDVQRVSQILLTLAGTPNLLPGKGSSGA